ncbi:MAG: hypothetical protein NTY53_06900 [Kiritimatiellaeota bacterium]|nr:hypothetical protein [Kiritimatiellota bacterium]
MTTNRLFDERRDDQDRELYDLQNKVDEEIRTDTRNLVLIAGAIAAFAMPALTSVDSPWQKLAIGAAIIFFLFTIVLGCLRLAYVLADLRRAIADLLAWKQHGDKEAKDRYDKRQTQIRSSKITGFGFVISAHALFAAGIVFLMFGIVLSLLHV